MDRRDAVALSLLPAARQRRSMAGRARARPGVPEPRLEDLLGSLGAGAAEPGRWSAATLRARAETLVARADALGVAVVPWGEEGYPRLLAEIADPPPVLWVRGELAALDTVAVAIVGSRAGSAYALAVAARLAEDLATQGVTVVSGLARGVDAAAHRGALSAAQGTTVAVLGSGIDIVYPSEHRQLAEQIVTRGALVSELPPGTPPRARHFPQRNRLISGLSRAVVIVEASERSGSLITARWALDQGRDVMAVPGNVLGGRNRGAHGLLKDGAKVVESADDILEELHLARTAPPSSQGAAAGGGGALLARMVPGESYDLDALVRLTGLDGATLLATLLELELQGAVARAEGSWLRSPHGPVVR